MKGDYSKKPTHVYVGRDDGGCALAIHSDYRDKDTGQFVAEMIAGGLVVERVEWARYLEIAQEKTFMQCGCPRLQPGLFDELTD